MEEDPPCESTHREKNQRVIARDIGYDAFERRIFRFREGVQGACSDKIDDDLFYSNVELIDAYNKAEILGQEAIEACAKFKDALRMITNIRREIITQHKENKRRALGSDVLNRADVELPPNN